MQYSGTNISSPVSPVSPSFVFLLFFLPLLLLFVLHHLFLGSGEGGGAVNMIRGFVVGNRGRTAHVTQPVKSPHSRSCLALIAVERLANYRRIIPPLE
ncbi:hypothetical protein E2C01_061491 [Portunus trituberculatus]|uniref:Uncharacterized protein n=1 Tax=Portunus trituberculatus TaxID=210409 RepID=A0A5B7HEI6_PORTR|nr:hypothetical protein [Portunus trituberculatus]